ncbi:dihydroorotate dehydrogenase [Daldinia caldariorum]|uniref:dihydroorotate dehydrogenase n=1 Tax=Daldinia caldariorum TaxID=326644 RepID=UPI00200899A7|nr:dihydroorotate dehydrogenase [Daldinia caldariorum]KAI1465954.1 dihydroorotate dehydrogenase [Daldinia caldariorum]
METATPTARSPVPVPVPLRIVPPLLNSANPWATTKEDLRALYECASTGAVTTRTATLDGFGHDAARHRYAFFDGGTHAAVVGGVGGEEGMGASLNNMGYSPVPLDEYLAWIEEIVLSSGKSKKQKEKKEKKEKVFIVSITGSPDDVAEGYRRIAALAARIVDGAGADYDKEGQYVPVPLAVEINLSCPNIPSAPPPAYSAAGLEAYLEAVALAATTITTTAAVDRGGSKAEPGKGKVVGVPWGVKIPPYTHAGQFEMLVGALKGLAAHTKAASGGGDDDDDGRCPVGFVTATNTLGSCLLLDGTEGNSPVLGGEGVSGIGGMAGAPLHPLALGNVATLRRMLDSSPETACVQIIGVGGVSDSAGYRRMRDVGAAAVGVGTALGKKGVGVFREIEDGLRVSAGDGDGEAVKW